MEIRVVGMDFGFGNPVAEIGGGLDLQEIWLELVGEILAIRREPGLLIYSTLHLKYICFFLVFSFKLIFLFSAQLQFSAKMSQTQVNKYLIIGDVIRYVEMNRQYKTSSLMHALRAFFS